MFWTFKEECAVGAVFFQAIEISAATVMFLEIRSYNKVKKWFLKWKKPKYFWINYLVNVIEIIQCYKLRL